MKMMTGLWIAGAALALGAIAVTASDSGPPAEQVALVHNGRTGFVVTDFAFALSKDASETGACPHGWTLGLRSNSLRCQTVSATRVNPNRTTHAGLPLERRSSRRLPTGRTFA